MSTLNTCTSSTRPASPSQGDMLYETDSYKTIIYDGSQWREYQSSNSPYDLDGTNNITLRPQMHFDAGKINGVDSSGNPSNGGSITGKWECCITNTYARQLSTSLQCTWYAGNQGGTALAGGAGANNKPYAYTSADYFYLTPSMVISRGRPFTYIYVAKPSTKFAPFGYPLETQDTRGHAAFFWGGNTFYMYHNQGGSQQTGLSGVSGLNNTDNAVVVRRENPTGEGQGDGTGTNTTIHIQGNASASNANTQTDDLTFGLLLYATSQFNSTGRLYEIMAFDSYLSNADLNSIGAYLNSKYSISWTDFS
jgi:hypothetical protein